MYFGVRIDEDINIADKNDVYEMLKKGYKQSQEKLKNSLNRTI